MLTGDAVDGRASFPMTVERALTAVTQSRLALLRAHRELSVALEISAGLRDENGELASDGSGRAWQILRAPRVLEQLDALREALLDAEPGGTDLVFVGESTPVPFDEMPTVSPPGGVHGEFPPISERSIVAPDAGRLHRRRLTEGRPVKENGIVAELRRGDVRIYVRSPVAGTFLSWMSAEGENVAPGRAVAWIRPTNL